MVCVCRLLQQPPLVVRHVLTGGNMFLSRHDMRLTYTYCDPRVLFLIGYDPSFLIGRTVYQFHNPSDAHKCSECHSTLIQSGTGVSKYYRFLGRTGTWVWMQTKATVVSDTRGKAQYIVCNNYIVSQQEGDRTHRMDLQQQQLMAPLTGGHPALQASDVTAKGAIDLQPISQVTSPLSSTDGDHEAQDDTGYNSAVSSSGSASASPCPGHGANLSGSGSSGVAGDASLGVPSLQRTLCRQKDCGADFGGIDSDSVMSTESTGLGFHSTLSSVLYGDDDDDDLSEPVSGLGEPYGPEPFTLGSMLEEGLSSEPASGLSIVQSDPFLSSGGSASVSSAGRGREGDNSGSVANVMEDMELLEDLLGRITDGDSSQDSVFSSAPPLFIGPRNRPARLDPSVSRAPKSAPGPAPCEPQPRVTLCGPQSLLRTLLDKDGEPIDRCSTPIVLAWAKTFPAVSLASDKPGQAASATAAVRRRGKTVGAVNKDASRGVWKKEAGDKRAAGQAVSRGKQLVMCAGNMVIVPRQMDLTDADHSGEEDDGEEEEVHRNEAVKSEEDEEEGGCDGVTLPQTLPEDLLDFAMQYCESLSDMDTALPDGMTGLDPDMWSSTVEDFITPDSFGHHLPTSLGKPTVDDSVKPSTVCVPEKTVTVSGKTPPQAIVDKQKDKMLPSDKMLGFTRESKSPKNPSPFSLSSASDIQSAIITSTRSDGRAPALTVSVRSVPGGGLKGVVITPLGKDKRATILKYGGGVGPSHPGGVGVKCVRLITPALSDHRYSSVSHRTHSPTVPQPVGKRMRTDWDRCPHPGAGKEGKGPTLLQSAVNSFPLPKISPSASCAISNRGYSPRSGSISPCKSLSDGSVGSGSQPTSPFPPPIPANGGGKPISAMTELEKHLRGLVEPPDERPHDSEDSLPPVEDSQSGGRPFLQRLLTGEISHERYRQIDYHLLYQERERRLSENSHLS